MKKVFILSFLFISSFQNGFSQSEGPNDAMSAVYSAFGCLACPGASWQNLTNISQTDHQTVDVLLAAYPNCFQGTCYFSRTLFAYDFGFAIPSGALIRGVSASVMRSSTAATDISDSLIMLYTGSPVGISHASTLFWTPNPMLVSYGDSTDTWGYTLTSDTINSSQFGLALEVMNKNLSASFITASVDHVTMTVYYSTGSGVASQTRTAFSVRVNYNRAASALNVFLPRDKNLNAVKLIDATGNMIFSGKPSASFYDSRSVQIPELRQGIYLAMLEIDNRIYTRKIVVQ